MAGKKLFLFALVICVTISINAQKIALVKGQKFELKNVNKMAMDMMGQSLNNESSSSSSVEVKEISSEGYIVNSTVTHLGTNMTGFGQDISFDSDKKEDMAGEMGQALKGKIGVLQEVKLDRKGKIISTGEQAAPDSPSGMGDMMGFSGDMIKGQSYPLFINLPDKAIKPGDSWVDSSGTPATLKTVTTYTLKGKTADGLQVSYTSTWLRNGPIQQNGMEMQLDLSGNVSGESIYELATGILKTSTSTADLKGTMGVMGQSVPINATINSTIDVKKL